MLSKISLVVFTRRASVWCAESRQFRLGIALLTNSDCHAFQSALPNQILDRFIAARLGRAPAEAAQITDSRESYEVSPGRQRTLAGQYLYDRSGYSILVFKEDGLGIERGKEFVPVTWVSEDEGFLPLDDAIRTQTTLILIVSALPTNRTESDTLGQARKIHRSLFRMIARP